MIAFFTQKAFASACGNSNLPNGLLFGGGFSALRQLGIEELGLVLVVIAVFFISFATIWLIGKALHGITIVEEAGVKVKVPVPILNLGDIPEVPSEVTDNEKDTEKRIEAEVEK
jgi:Amt family ammonium transporter